MFNPFWDSILGGVYFTKTFSEVWETADAFITDFNASPVFKQDAETPIDQNTAKTLYYLLYARYGNHPIASMDEYRFKQSLFTIIYAYAPTWAKRYEIQKNLRALSTEELTQGSRAIYNTANNPQQQPSTATLEELPYINSQNTTNYKRDKLSAYNELEMLLATDVTESFLSKFQHLFIQGAIPFGPIYYETEI